MKATINQENVYHASYDRTNFAVKEQGKQTYLRVTEQIRSLLQCRACKLQYIRKSGTTFNIRLNNYRKDPKSEKSIITCKHFNQTNHDFQQHAKFTLTEQIRKQTTTEETRKPLKKR